MTDAAANDRLDRFARASSLAIRGIEYADVVARDRGQDAVALSGLAGSRRAAGLGRHPVADPQPDVRPHPRRRLC